MALTSGTRIGPYEVTALIGEGGMGQVYRATDTNLGRQVAIKVLPDAFANDPERLARFEREAKTLAALNHSHIAQIYGLEKFNSISALVMELVEGPTLADRIAQGPIPVDEALPIAKQIAEALEAAHEQSIIHRDLKPANIKVRPDGTVKVLDFGLAKPLEALKDPNASLLKDRNISFDWTKEHPPYGLSAAPTVTTPAMMTGVGVLLGTAAYMSPEQARGRAVDKRSDIWAFGCVLYEMLTGERAFGGQDVSDTLAGVLRAEPDWNRLPANAPRSVRLLLRRCLQKDPKERLHDIGDARIEIRDAQTETSGTTTLGVPVIGRPQERLAWMAAVAVLAVALAVALVLTRRPTPVAPEMRVEITPPATSSPLHFAISPDGGRLVFVASGDEQPRLWVRALDAVAAQPLAGTENAEYPFWSPDSRSIGFFAGGKLKRVDTAGGPPQVVADVFAARGGTWNSDGTILFASASVGPLSRVSARAGEPAVVTRIVQGQVSHRFPQFLPDGKHFLFFAQGSATTQGIYWGSLDGSEPRRLVANDTAGAWAPPGRLLFVRQGALVATPFDAEKGEITGDAMTVADPVGSDAGFFSAGFSVSAEGRIAYRAGGLERRQLTWFERDGKRAGTFLEMDESVLLYPELSPDGLWVALNRTVQNNGDVWLIDLAQGGTSRFTFDAAVDYAPLWSPDGTRIAFRSNRKGVYDLYVKPASGAGSEELVWESSAPKSPLSWSSDGRFLLFYESDPKTNLDLWTLPMTGEGKPLPWLITPFIETLGQFSPDGRWVAYQSNESGSFEIYVQPFPAANAKWQISTQGGTMPRWRPDGKELFYIAPDLKLMAAAVTTSDTTFQAAPPATLFQTRIYGGGSQVLKHQYAVSRDGRFLITEPVEAAPTPITLILNWKPQP
jgi:Tol biopolymer transport system component